MTRPLMARPAAVPLAAVVVAAAGLAAVLGWKMTRPGVLEDLRVYRVAGQLVAGTIARGDGLYGDGFGLAQGVRPFTYAPFAAVLATPLGLASLVVVGVLWTAASLLALAWLVRVSYAPALDRFGAYRPLALAVAVVAWAIAVPVSDHLYFGQVGLFLAAACLADVTGRSPLPRGLLIGLAAGIKLVPGLFVVHLLVTGQRRAARTAVLTFAATVAAGAIVLPADSARFWTAVAWGGQRVGDDGGYRNQSLRGLADHLLPGGWASPAWLLAAVGVIVVWAVALRRAHRAGDDLLAFGLTAVTALLVSPVSWIHHAVWLVVVGGTLAGDLRSPRRRLALALLLGVLLVPWPRLGVAALTDSYTLLYAVLLAVLAVDARRRQRAVQRMPSAPAVQPT